MERIIYRKTLDVHKNGTQFVLQGFETADKLSRVVEISLMASGDAIDFPLERIVAVMYVTTPGATEPSINECTIKDNKVVYDVLPIVEEGITTMQLKLIETSIDGAKSVLASPKFAVEVTKSEVDDGGTEQKATFTAIEDFISKAEVAYGSRLERIELTSDCIFKAYYYDGTYYETDALRKLLMENSTDLDLDSLIKNGIANFTADEVAAVLDEKYIKLFGEAVYDTDLMRDYTKATFVQWDAETENTPYKAELTECTEGFALAFGTVENNHTIIAWTKGEDKAKHYTHYISNGKVKGWKKLLIDLTDDVDGILPIENGGTGASTKEGALTKLVGVLGIEHGGTGATTANEAIKALGIDKYQKPWNIDRDIAKINGNNGVVSAKAYYAFGSDVESQPVENSFGIFMKNSGALYLDFTMKCHVNGYTMPDLEKGDALLKVLVNDTEVLSEDLSTYEYTGTSEYRFYEKSYTIPLTVSFGDVITIYLRACHTYGDASNEYTEISANDIKLLANAETAYIYYSLNDTPIEEITATDILNALTGGDE